MQSFRNSSRILRWWLALSLLLTPVFSALRAEVVAMQPVHHVTAKADAAHAHHHAVDADSDSQSDASTGCTQHDSCGGQCCPGCGHCAGALTISPALATVPHPTLTPRDPKLLSHIFVALRERPPRNSSL